MSLWNHPRLTAALCTVAVLGCAAAPAVFLAAADAAGSAADCCARAGTPVATPSAKSSGVRMPIPRIEPL